MLYLPIFSDSKFKKSDAFIGFQKDTPASVVFQATNLLRSSAQAGTDAFMRQYAKIQEEEVEDMTWEESVCSLGFI
jgi:hypothetical protein